MKLMDQQHDMEIPDEEPVFILRATDPLAADTLRYYGRKVQDHQVYESARETAIAANEHAMEMDNYLRERAG